MNIVPTGHSGPVFTLHAGVQGVVGLIKLAANATFIHPRGLTASSRVSPPRQVGKCKPGATITARAHPSGIDAQVAEFVTLGHRVGEFTFFATQGKGLAAGLLPPQVKASSVGDPTLERTGLEKMLALAQDIVEGRRAAHEPAGGNMRRLFAAIAPGLPKGAAPFFIHAQINAYRLSVG